MKNVFAWLKKLKGFVFTKRLKRRCGVYYINGAEVLPPPLEKDEESEDGWEE